VQVLILDELGFRRIESLRRSLQWLALGWLRGPGPEADLP